MTQTVENAKKMYESTEVLEVIERGFLHWGRRCLRPRATWWARWRISVSRKRRERSDAVSGQPDRVRGKQDRDDGGENGVRGSGRHEYPSV